MESSFDGLLQLQKLDLRLSYFTRQYGNNVFFHLLRRKWLANVSARAAGERLDHVGLAALGGNHHYRKIFRTLDAGKLLNELDAIHDRHVDVAENEIDWT